jgi:hypothetical protein
MSREQADDDFEKINLAIDQMFTKLRNCCPCCVATGLMWRGSFLYQQVAGAEETVALCRDIADSIEDELPVGGTQH